MRKGKYVSQTLLWMGFSFCLGGLVGNIENTKNLQNRIIFLESFHDSKMRFHDDTLAYPGNFYVDVGTPQFDTF